VVARDREKTSTPAPSISANIPPKTKGTGTVAPVAGKPAEASSAVLAADDFQYDD
jgi:hypothetical protein